MWTPTVRGRRRCTDAAPYAGRGQNARADANKASVRFMHMSVRDTLEALEVPSLDEGLSTAYVERLRNETGVSNEFEKHESMPLWQKWFLQFAEPMNALLLGSAAVSLLVGQANDAICITVALSIVITVGLVQEYRSEKSLEALSRLVPPRCTLTRDGQHDSALASELVPGDVVSFQSGDRVPADVRLTSVVDLEVDESALTGETQAVHKSDKTIPDGDDDISERHNIAFMGTLVQRGSAKGIVIAVGIDTEFGSIFGMVDEVDEKQTPLQRSMANLAQQLSAASLAIIAVIMLVGLLQHQSWLEMFTIAVSLAVAAIPEGLPIVVTVTLALGALRMSVRRAIVKKLPSVEALGCVSVVCTDKTGTLTTGRMHVVECYTVPDGHVEVPRESSSRHKQLSTAMRRNLQAGQLCNNAEIDGDGKLIGSSTEVAMYAVPGRFGLDNAHGAWKRTHETPFNSERKYMAVTGQGDASKTPGNAQLMKGAPEVVLRHCHAYFAEQQQPTTLSDRVRSQINEAIADMSHRGLRVLATAAASSASGKYAFCGLHGIQDPPRDGVKSAIGMLQRGGVHVAMITGDAQTTASAIGRQLGLVTQGSSSVMTGHDIDTLSDRQLSERVRNVAVFARTSPEHKLRIVSALQAGKAVVGMTGDGGAWQRLR